MQCADSSRLVEMRTKPNQSKHSDWLTLTKNDSLILSAGPLVRSGTAKHAGADYNKQRLLSAVAQASSIHFFPKSPFGKL